MYQEVVTTTSKMFLMKCMQSGAMKVVHCIVIARTLVFLFLFSICVLKNNLRCSSKVVLCPSKGNATQFFGATFTGLNWQIFL